jgi:hypothetical protein
MNNLGLVGQIRNIWYHGEQRIGVWDSKQV